MIGNKTLQSAVSSEKHKISPSLDISLNCKHLLNTHQKKKKTTKFHGFIIVINYASFITNSREAEVKNPLSVTVQGKFISLTCVNTHRVIKKLKPGMKIIFLYSIEKQFKN